MKKAMIAMLIALFGTAVLSGCATVEGAGETVENAGEVIQDAADPKGR